MRYQERDYHRHGQRRRQYPARGRNRAQWQHQGEPPDFGPWDADEEDDDMERSEAYRELFDSDFGSRRRRFGSRRGDRARSDAGDRQRDAGLGDNYSEPEIEQYGYDYGQPIFAGEYGEQSRDYDRRGRTRFGRFDQRGQRVGRGDRYGQRGFGHQAGQYGQPFGEGQRSDEQWGQRRPSSGERWSGTGSWERVGRGMHSGKGPKGYQRSDERIREDLCDHLTDDPELDASNIEVSVQNCEVTLSGTVESRQLKRLAEDIADGCPGVRDVRNEIRVRRQSDGGDPPSGQRNESDTQDRRFR